MTSHRLHASRIFTALLAVIALTLWPSAASADDGDNLWDESGVLVADVLGSGDEVTSWNVVTDGNGGGIVFWRRYYRPQGDERIQAAHVRHDGVVEPWPEESLPAIHPAGFSIISDHDGGVIVAYSDGIGDDAGFTVYAQRLTANGVKLWTADGPMGTRLSYSFGHFDHYGGVLPVIASDGIGGVYVSWHDRLVYVEPDGDLSAPGLDGIKLIPQDTGRVFGMVSDGTGGLPPLNLPGGVYAAWKNPDPPDFEIRAQYVKNGLEWGPDGLVVELGIGVFVSSIASDAEGGVFIAWHNNTGAIHLQRFNSNGEALWSPEAVLVGGSFDTTQVLANGTGGAYATYFTSIPTIQQFAADGALMWSVSLGSEPYSVEIIGDGAGGVLPAYDAFWEGRNIMASRFDPNGYRLFTKWVGAVGPEGYGQLPVIVFDGTGPAPHGAVIVWTECDPSGRCSPFEPPVEGDQIYAQKIEVVDYDPPTHDDCGSAYPVTVGDYTGTLIGATSDGSVNCTVNSDEPDVWGVFNADRDGLLIVTTCGTNDQYEIDSDMDTVLSLHSACPGTGSNELSCNDDWPAGTPSNACIGIDQGSSRDSVVSRSMSAGETVWIRLSRFSGTIGGHYLLHVAFDTDGDGHTDDTDNCQLVINGGQVDTDRDGIGNICDADFSDDCAINFIDLNIMKQQFFTTDLSPDWDPDVDLNNDGVVNFVDLQIMKPLFFGPPGPSGRPNICEAGCGLRDTGLDPAQHFAVEMFVRGSFNGWGSAPPYNLINFGDGVYRTQVEVGAAQHELKIADELWTLEYDAPTRLLLGVPLLLDGGPPDGSDNIVLNLENNGCINFRVEVVDPALPPAQVELTVNRKQ